MIARPSSTSPRASPAATWSTATDPSSVLTPERLDRATLAQATWLAGVFLGDSCPGCAIVTAVACGVSNSVHDLFPAMSIGALLYISSTRCSGSFWGQPVLDFLERIHIPFACSIARAAVADPAVDIQSAAGTWSAHRQRRCPSIANATARWCTRRWAGDDLVDVLFNRVHQPAGTSPQYAGHVSSNKPRASGVCVRPASFSPCSCSGRPGLSAGRRAVGLLLYAVWVEPRCRETGRLAQGAGVSLLPLMGSLIVVHAAAGPGWFSRRGRGRPGSGRWRVIRHAAYGVQLGCCTDLPDAAARARHRATRPTKCRPDASPMLGRNRDPSARWPVALTCATPFTSPP